MLKDGHKKWRVVKYVNGLGDIFFRVHYTYLWFPFWFTSKVHLHYDETEPREFSSHEAATSWVEENIQRRQFHRRKDARKRV
ncbi:hypothetical protein VPHD148_0042 [Vibrio phage D148]